MVDFVVRVVSAAIAFVVAASAANAEPRRWRIDPEHFAIAFEATHIGFSKVLGQFLKAEGHFVFDETTRTLLDAEIRVDARSVFTNHEARDNHLRAADFLDANNHPVITFKMTRAVPKSENSGVVEGLLTFRGKTLPLSVEVTLNKIGRYPWGENYVLGASARTVVKRSLWGSTYAVDNGWVADEIPIQVELEAIRE
ncbi:MAG: YceI family protein [Geminicoccaceae bacterium]|nr:YceI family protein [Geminicoccaceae bacterium]MDW8340979.1 YceI family protein [Geminicoccaceae bacterium]